ncbi:DUF3857 domain-containing protein [Antarcticibacterium arcticum]|uniref:DUF3857 domain-containing protein n=1 Tax=Antarcticibacterium arcticum TaxID=2585771 RepID=A0A5B8YIY3_9FLAO|nr:DUF3857 domain-containing protein [Antarcticibacterium arcticum]QED37902.1 DUF3857 domain-containing protein [Antarcticibacterium arcticum]
MQKFYTTVILSLFFVFSYGQDFKFGKVSKEEVMEKSHPIEKDANAAVLFRNVSTYFEYYPSTGFTLITNVHERIKIYNKEGFDWATREINYYKGANSQETIAGLKGVTYNMVGGKLVEDKLKKDGIFEEDVTKYQLRTKITMPAVNEGSVIEYQYSLRSPFVTTIDDIVLQYTIPINVLDVKITIPEFLGFSRHFNPRSRLVFNVQESRKPFSLTSSSMDRNGFTVVEHSISTSKVEYQQNTYSFVKTAIPALKEESHIDYLSNYGAFIKWELQYTKFPNAIMENLTQTWEGVTKSIFNDGGYDKELSRTNYFQKDLDKLLEGETIPLKKAQKIYAFAKSKVKWNGYLGYEAESGGNKIYKEGEGNIGDINLMLTAMLRYAGLKANPVLVSTVNNGIPLFPTRKGFNYVISSLDLNGERILLDATEENASFGELPKRARNWNGRIIQDKENSDWVDLMPKTQSKNSYSLNIEIDDENNLRGKSTNILTGLYAKSYRDNFKNVNTDSYIEILEKNKGNIEIANVETDGQLLIGSDIKETYTFEIKSGVDKINDKLYIKPLLYLSESDNPFKADKRSHPIIFDFPLRDSRVVNIIIPEGFEVESLPENSIFQLMGESGIFKYLTSQSGKYLRIESVLELKNLVYTPEDYDNLKQFYAYMVEKHSETIVLKKS